MEKHPSFCSEPALLRLGLYIALFPQLIAGPIVRYHDIARQLIDRKVTTECLAKGIQRFLERN